jgi:prepilin-type N-terminal cleavage/methylation domain-containing protein
MPRRPERAFSLVEVLIGTSIAGILSAVAIASVLTLGRSGAAAASYVTIDRQASQAIHYFSRDVRMASALTWNSAQSVTLTVPGQYADFGGRVTYAWEADAASSAYRCFYRKGGDAASANPLTILARNVVSFSFARFDRLNAASHSDATTKRLDVTMTLGQAPAPGAPVTTNHASVAVILRNKFGL